MKYLPSWIDGKILVAYFDLEEKNALVADITGTQRQIGKRNSKGVEVQADAYIAKNWNVALAYTYTKAE